MPLRRATMARDCRPSEVAQRLFAQDRLSAARSAASAISRWVDWGEAMMTAVDAWGSSTKSLAKSAVPRG
jgi:hypothetical protein